jgi:transcriptional regulator with GAF, ATPase, and Fis domain
LIARALHEKSERRERPFVAVNCAALSDNLFESELFGHEKGAFTGAIALKRGRFELADGGTIFLDEVGEVPLTLQGKLLRVLEDHIFERVGGTQMLPVDIRVLSATNRDLRVEVQEKRFREDLFHRLNVVELRSPPLRDRQEDIPDLAEYFLRRACATCKRQVQGISEPVMNLLMDYSWPGNIRELRNAMERAVAIGVSDWILPEDLPESLLESAPDLPGARYHSSVSSAKRDTILDAYRQGNGDYKQAAALLGLHPNYLLRLVRNMNLRDEIKRQSGGKSSGASAGI